MSSRLDGNPDQPYGSHYTEDELTADTDRGQVLRDPIGHRSTQPRRRVRSREGTLKPSATRDYLSSS